MFQYHWKLSRAKRQQRRVKHLKATFNADEKLPEGLVQCGHLHFKHPNIQEGSDDKAGISDEESQVNYFIRESLLKKRQIHPGTTFERERQAKRLRQSLEAPPQLEPDIHPIRLNIEAKSVPPATQKSIRSFFQRQKK
jgi:hypothetical protein